ncbi:AKH_1a_G0027210.mRNA.1.CDS.1 [Saccharomyces cerevisiae]|nr:AKH_1a_G0027210.mRNA.1.CDS.1 [Saccharomyces cerevisiae]CAI6720059.1 AKH_1a_G0027210.mRNA.1.CDS.1 [Saccharomyces cerevisiae]
MKKTDFWRETFYGLTRDSGHFLGVETGSAFTAQVRVQGSYESLYDQAGIMVRIDDGHWLKAGIEISDGHAMLSSVLTNGKSDWSTAVYGGNARDFWLRVTVEKGVLRLQVSSDKKTWPLKKKTESLSFNSASALIPSLNDSFMSIHGLASFEKPAEGSSALHGNGVLP